MHCLLVSGVASAILSREIRSLAAQSDANATVNVAAVSDVAQSADATSVFGAALAATAAADAATTVAADVMFAPEFAARVALAVDEAIWAEISNDAALWLQHADQVDGTLQIDVSPLWFGKNPLEKDWKHLRRKLLAADTPDDRGADWSFWVKWYDDILAGHPQNWDMLYEIATTDAIDWNASAREVNDTINRIVEKFENIKSDQDKVDTVSDRPKVSPPPEVDAGYVAESLQRHAPALPPALDAISFIIENEIKRLQEKNYQDDLEAAESKRLFNVFMLILRATEEMSAHVPVDRAVQEEDTKAAKSLINIYDELFSSWPRANAPDVVDATCRAGLTAGATGIMVMCGAPAMVAVGIARLAYGGPRLKDVGKTLKDVLKE